MPDDGMGTLRVVWVCRTLQYLSIVGHCGRDVWVARWGACGMEEGEWKGGCLGSAKEGE